MEGIMVKQSIRLFTIIVLGILISSSIGLFSEQNDEYNDNAFWKEAEETIKETLETFPHGHLAAVIETVNNPECEQIEGKTECRVRVRVVENISSGSKLSRFEISPGEFYILSGDPSKSEEPFKPSRHIFVGSPVQGRQGVLGGQVMTSSSASTEQNIQKVREIVNKALKK